MDTPLRSDTGEAGPEHQALEAAKPRSGQYVEDLDECGGQMTRHHEIGPPGMRVPSLEAQKDSRKPPAHPEQKICKLRKADRLLAESCETPEIGKPWRPGRQPTGEPKDRPCPGAAPSRLT